MSITISTSVDIDAPKHLVWDVLTDFAAYDEWNPDTKIEGTAQVGTKLTVHMGASGGPSQTLVEAGTKDALPSFMTPRQTATKRTSPPPGLWFAPPQSNDHPDRGCSNELVRVEDDETLVAGAKSVSVPLAVRMASCKAVSTAFKASSFFGYPSLAGVVSHSWVEHDPTEDYAIIARLLRGAALSQSVARRRRTSQSVARTRAHGPLHGLYPTPDPTTRYRLSDNLTSSR